ncbi:MAG: cytochrome P450 [Parvibaculaceae bacterium]|nr:cytochrome P450 [Parvibaculaceae bacterium]HBM87790.1 cytochrome P450 [Rhodobiaceae bacterium]|tara:strand:+ start:3608 stop:4864 length:1257 start_codon:yes stop_codon:yes gene_type:complete
MSEAAVMSDAASEDAYSLPLDKINVGQPHLFKENAIWPYFERLRNEDPVHFCAESDYGPYWSVTKYNDIMKVDTNHGIYSSESGLGGITIRDPMADFQLPMFIAMDQPKHDVQRKTVSPIVAPGNLAILEGVIRERAGKILDGLPLNETFNWVDRVSIELTTQMLATLFDFPWEDRRKLTYWSDVATADINGPLISSMDERREILMECAEYFTRLWNERVNSPEPNGDLISMLAHGEATRNMEPMEYLGNVILLIVGGNDTTRNSITGGLLALNEHPEQYAKLRADHGLIETMVPEIIRWQTPLAHMRRTALEDTELGGKQIKKGDKVVMWYVSGNRDGEVIENPNQFIIDRERPRQHLSFGFGIHRCVGNRLAEMQLRVLWEEIMKRFDRIEVVGEPVRVLSNFVKGFEQLPVQIKG